VKARGVVLLYNEGAITLLGAVGRWRLRRLVEAALALVFLQLFGGIAASGWLLPGRLRHTRILSQALRLGRVRGFLAASEVIW
jgi:hypothetical protein